jgi:membrane associated rhomboid family serine protease
MNSIIDDLRNAWSRPNNSAIQLILINVGIFIFLFVARVVFKLLQLPLIADVINDQFLLYADLDKSLYRPWTFFTYAFNHAGIFHIFWNMIGLFWFGRLFNETLGSQRLINLYVLGAIAGGVVYVGVFNFFGAYHNSALIGASGAVYAIVIAISTYLPNYTFNLLLLGPVKIIYIGMFFILISLFDLERGSNIGGNLAHLAGALIGFIYIHQFRKGRDIGSFVHKAMDFIKSFFVHRPKVKVSHRSGTTSKRKPTRKTASDVSQSEIDAILDKISEKGYESLSKEEKEKLFNASK